MGQAMNEWSNGKVIHIEVCDFFFNMKPVQWKGKTITVEFDCFQMMIRQWMKGDNFNKAMTKEEALDLAFEMSDFS